MSRQSSGCEKVKFGNREVSVDAVERVFGAIRSGCQEIRPEGVTITEINALAKVGNDRATYSAKYLLQEGRVAMTVQGQRHLYRIADRPKKKADVDPPDPEPDPSAKKKRKPNRTEVSRLRLIKSRHKALLEDKERRQRRMDRMLGADADAED